MIALGAGLSDVLTALNNDHNRFPQLDVVYSSQNPLSVPILVNLPENGIRLRFDAPEQRLRLIEIIDLSKDRFTVKNESLITGKDDSTARPSLLYRRVYQLFGASYPGEYNKPANRAHTGTYVVSYPGIALSFPLDDSAWSPDVDHAKMLATSASAVTSIAIFEGKSWPEARKGIYTRKSAFPMSLQPVPRHKESMPDELEMINIVAPGKLILARRTTSAITITLHETTAQDLITDLGAPDAVYKRPGGATDLICRRRNAHSRRPSSLVPKNSYGSTPSSVSSANTDTYDADFEEDDAIDGPDVVRPEDQYYCYYQHGMDILLSATAGYRPSVPTLSSAQSKVTRVVIHGNIPGSYPFNRHRRCRWSLDYVPPTRKQQEGSITSETDFYSAHPRLLEHFRGVWPEKDMKEGKVLVRDWNGDSPSGSAILIGEESEEEEDESWDKNKEQWLKNTRLYKFPDLMFEVMHNGVISELTVY